MYFDLISDFHTEFNKNRQQLNLYTQREGEPVFYDWAAEQESDILVIAGDTSNSVKKTKKIVAEAARFYKQVLFVDGNHEAYYHKAHLGDSVFRDKIKFHNFAKKSSNITYLNSWINGTQFVYGDTVFIGCNGWYDFNMAEGMSVEAQRAEWEQKSNDSYYPVYLGNTPDLMAKHDFEYIKEQVDNYSTRDDINNIVIVTHTVPIKTALVPMGHEWYSLNGAYGNSMMKDIWNDNSHGKIKTWVFGHTHNKFDVYANDVRFVCNPRGYGNSYKFTGIRPISTENDNGSAFGDII